MIKINEIEMLKLINNSDLNAIKSYIDNEIIMQLKTDTSDAKRNKNFIKLADKFKKEAIKIDRPALAGAFTQNDYTCLCDGFRAFRIKQPIESFGSIAKISDEVTSLNLAQIIPDTRDMKEINIDLKDLQLKYKEYKSLSAKEKKDIWKKMFVSNIDENQKIYLNIEYLMDAHNILNFDNCKFYVKNPVSPLLIVDNKGNDALVLPIRPPAAAEN